MGRQAISSNHYSFDDQVKDAVNNLSGEARDEFNQTFPEYNHLYWSGPWVDTYKSKVDIEFMSWVADWIEINTDIYWEDGEPWLIDGEGEGEDEMVW